MRKRGSKWILAGLLLIAAALALTLFNFAEQERAQRAAGQAAQELDLLIPSAEDRDAAGELIIPDYLLNPEMDMPETVVDGVSYIGVLHFPTLALELPVISSWSDALLKTAPCRYSGSAYLDNLVICGHNYRRQFGPLARLHTGDEVTFTDADGNVFSYAVAALETLQPTDIEEMTGGEWALTLFTCTLGGQSRVTVRCERIGADTE